MEQKLTTMQKRALAACDRIKVWDSFDFQVEWVKSRTWGNCPRILYRGQKAAHAGGCGYDKLSSVVCEFLQFLHPDVLCWGGSGVRTVIDKLAGCGWRLEHTYDGKMEDGFRITRLAPAGETEKEETNEPGNKSQE